MEIKAFKMDGLGNDFVIIDQRDHDYQLKKDQIIKICDRNFIGCDQLIFINKSDQKDTEVGIFHGINEEGKMLLQTPRKLKIISSGECSIKGIY